MTQHRGNGGQRRGLQQGDRPDPGGRTGLSLGGPVAQERTLAEPELVCRLMLLGTGPRGGEGMASLTPDQQHYQ